MKRLLLTLLIVSVLFCGCADTVNKSDNGEENVSSENTQKITEEVSVLYSEPTDAGAETTSQQSDDTVASSGKEVSIFKDNTFDCDYIGYKEIGYDFSELHFSVKVPEDWISFRFYGEDEAYQNMLIGFPIYNRPLDFDIVTYDDSAKFANDPLHKSIFFLAWTLKGVGLKDSLSGYAEFYEFQTKFDYETYVDKKGRSMKVYFLDGLPRLAVYDDFFNRCIIFNLDSEEQIPIVVNMINSIEVSLSREAEFTLKTAERLGYTIIPPEE